MKVKWLTYLTGASGWTSGRVWGRSDCSPGGLRWPPRQQWPPLGVYHCSSQSLGHRGRRVLLASAKSNTSMRSMCVCVCHCRPWQPLCSCGKPWQRECLQIRLMLITLCHTLNPRHSGSDREGENKCHFHQLPLLPTTQWEDQVGNKND